MSEKNRSTGGSTAAGLRTQGAHGLRRTGGSPRRPWIIGLVSALAAVILVPLGLFLIAYIMVDVPEPDELPAPQISQIYASDSQTELARIVPPEGNRRSVPVEDIPDPVKNAVLAAEDREFYTNNGFSFSGFGRAVLGQLRGDSSAGGGSTVTQQYVKNALVGNEHSYLRKAKELVYSVKMANEWSKEEVLGAYLNTVYFGRNAYGVEAASHAYFNKSVRDLTPAEAAVLAASIQRPSQLDPWTNRAEAEQRWNYVLDGMVDVGTLDPQERATMVYPDTIDPAASQAGVESDAPSGMIKNHVVEELDSLGISEDTITTEGLKITTTIDPVAQQAAVDAARNNLKGQNEKLRTAVVSVDPRTGGVRAYYGGEDPYGWDYGSAGLQTGSTFKIFGLAAALQQGIPLSTMYSSAPVQLPGSITVTNSDNMTCGYCSIREALKQSLNTSFIRLQQDLENGPTDTANMAHNLGVAESFPGVPHTLTEDNGASYEGVILGQYQTRPIDMAVGLGTLADEGVFHQTHFIQKVENAQGEVLYEHPDGDGERRLDANIANNVISAMLPIAAYSNGNALAGGRPSAAKTGTTQLGDTGQNKDAWMIGATPQLSTAVWVGTEDGSPITTAWGGPIYGAGLPATIWKSTMDNALQNEDIEYFSEAQPITVTNRSLRNANVPPPGWYNRQRSTTTSSTAKSEPSTPAEQPSAPAPNPGIQIPGLPPIPLPTQPAEPAPAPGGGQGGTGNTGGGNGNSPEIRPGQPVPTG
ncbi:transglycosylase domain-containing protein [Corynebacterium poyangense]|uniref:transglycosylase domain-containing protein n=1 Tax=Corynebacterium poyangense TaxID=2684405 RepID=UPI0021E1FC4F